MSKPNVTAEQLQTLKAIEKAFSKNVIANYQGDALKLFRKNASLKQMFNLVVASRRFDKKLNKNAPAAEQAEALARYCSAALPVLKKSFGEDLLVKALPSEAKEQDIIDLCRALGSNDLADLCEKAKNLPPISPAAGQKPQP
ncbi:MAG: hypothetical protein K8R48_04150 [Alphaproteobacteria bacterium]|nr:hypothetical protein [Alphaproteobacteria bacterium]